LGLKTTATNPESPDMSNLTDLDVIRLAIASARDALRVFMRAAYIGA
jgi:hypothetical protein